MKISFQPTRLARTGMAALFLAAIAAPVAITNYAQAGTLSNALVRFDRMAISQATTGTVCAKAATTGTEAKVLVTYPTGYTLGTAANFTVDTATTTGWPSGGTAWPSIATASNVTGQVVTFASGDLTVGTLYCFNWTNSAAVTTKSSATSSNPGTIETQTSGSAQVDIASYSTATISNDQIVVTATVPQSFSFALDGNTDALGTLSTGSVTPSPTPRNATINTNAKNGWLLWAKDANTGLSSAAASATIGSTTPGTNSTLTAGTQGYNTGITSTQTSGSGTITVATPFVGATAGQGGGLDTTLRTLATSNGTANNTVMTIKNNVAISATTAAATDYTDTITVVAAGLF